MAALTSLMTSFGTSEDSWLTRSSTSDPSTSEVKDGNGNHDATKTSIEIKKVAQITQR